MSLWTRLPVDLVSRGCIILRTIKRKSEGRVKSIAKILLFSVVAILIGCDPGITIRQVPSRKFGTVYGQLAIEISPVNSFSYSRFYGAKTKLTNTPKSSITITGCELADRSTIYESRLGGGEYCPIELAPGSSKSFGPFFELHDPVRDMFKNSAELRVHYPIEGRQQLASATLRGGSLH